jgi:hypothetical protein
MYKNKVFKRGEWSGTPEVKTYKTVILPVLLYECETCPPTLREEHRLRSQEQTKLRN